MWRCTMLCNVHWNAATIGQNFRKRWRTSVNGPALDGGGEGQRVGVGVQVVVPQEAVAVHAAQRAERDVERERAPLRARRTLQDGAARWGWGPAGPSSAPAWLSPNHGGPPPPERRRDRGHTVPN